MAENTRERKTLKIKHLPGINYLVIEKEVSDDFFLSNATTITISVYALSALLNFLVKQGYLSYKILEGILEEYHSS